MILYHGSNTPVYTVDLSKSRTNKDFGRGFYLSEQREQAEKMARFKTQTEGGALSITAFDFADSALQDGTLNVKVFAAYSEDWAKFVLENRKNGSLTQIHNFDIVYGPIANDKVGAQIRKFENGDIDFSEFWKS